MSLSRPALSRVRSVAVAVAVLSALTAAPASALFATASDPVSTPATADVRSVRYVDGERATVTWVKVRHLPRAGAVVVRIGRTGTEVSYVAKATRSANGATRTTLAYVTPSSRTVRTCSVGTAWSLATDTVRVTVPQACLDFGRFLVRHSFRATFSSGGDADRAPARVVGRGDSPGCVTPAELDSLRVGQAMDSVHTRFDTAGVFEGTEAGTFSRSYSGCGDGSVYEITFRAGSRTVLGWVVLGPPPTGPGA